MPYKLLDKRAFNEAYNNEVTDWCNSSILNSSIPAHRDRWIEVRRYGQVAIEYRCGARFKIEANGFDGLTDDGKTYTCPGILRKSLGLHNWPSSIKRSPRNTNKLPILKTIEQLGGVVTEAEIRNETRINKNIIHSSLLKYGSARVPYVMRSEERRPQPEGFAYEWGLTDRGKQWLKWAQRKYKN